MREFLYQAMIEGYDSLCNQLKTKTAPTLKAKSQKFIRNVGVITAGIKDGLVGKKPKASELMNENIVSESRNQSSGVEANPKTVRTREEIEQIVYAMRSSAVTLTACIRMLNNSVMADDGTDPQLRIQIQRNLQALSTSDVMRQIELLLEDKNRALLDEAEFNILSSFKSGYLLADQSKIPISKYLNN